MEVSSHPPIAAELEGPLEEIRRASPGSLTAEGIEQTRSMAAAYSPSDEQLRRGGTIEVEERRIPGPAGAPDLSVLICRPTRVPNPVAVIYNTHGGGMVAGDSRTAIDVPLDWVEQLGVVVVSVEYRLAPEHPHPAPVEDCYAGLVWTASHLEELGVDGAQLLIAGESAGGGLAAGVALMARDRGGPTLMGQILMAPMLDDRNETPSSHELDGEGQWDRTSNLTGWTALLGGQRGAADVSPYAAPARAADLSGLPPTLIDVGSVEVFRDEVVDYAVRLWRAGGTVELHVWPGGFHGFEIMVPQAALSQHARSARVNWLRRVLASG